MQIEKNIPIPPKRGKWSHITHAMKAGESVLCLNITERDRIRGSIYSSCKGYKPVVRNQPNGTWRVWKIKKEDKDND